MKAPRFSIAAIGLIGYVAVPDAPAPQAQFFARLSALFGQA